jgi:hypothetical protein
MRLDAQLGAAPMSSLAIVPDRVVRPQADPLGQRPVALARGGQQLLGSQALVTANDLTT